MSEGSYVEEKMLRVSGGSDPSKVAGALLKFLKEGASPILSAVGAGAVNQMMKAVCVARRMVASEGRDLLVRPGFRDEDIDGEVKTAIVVVPEIR